MPKPSNGRWPALGRPLIALNSSYFPSKSAVLRHFLYLQSQQKHQKEDHIESVYNSLKNICDNLRVQIQRKDKVKEKITKLHKDYFSKIGKNVSRKDSEVYQRFKRELSETFDVINQSSQSNQARQSAHSSNNQFCSFEAVSLDDVVISSSEEEDEDSNVIDLSFNEVVECAFDLSDDKSPDPDYRANLRSRLDTEVRKKILSPELLDTLDRIKLSSNSAFRLIAALANEFDIDISKVVFSVSTINRYRHLNRINLSNHLKEVTDFPTHCTLHWDGVQIFDIHLKKFVHHLAIKVTGPNFEQVLAIVRTEDGAAKTFVPFIIEQLRDWEIDDRVQFLNFDTTAVNTGKSNLKRI